MRPGCREVELVARGPGRVPRRVRLGRGAARRSGSGTTYRGRPRFGHGRRPRWAHGDVVLLGCYHPSQQNTFTGKLTEAMLDAVLGRAADIARMGRPLYPNR